jgi:hypothetical protein
MHSQHATPIRISAFAGPAEAFEAGIGTWCTLAVDLPLRIAAETLRFTSRRLQAQADHFAALGGCGSLKAAVALQTTFLTQGVAAYQAEAITLSQEVAEESSEKAA